MADQPEEITVLDKFKDLRPPSKRVRVIQCVGIFFVLSIIAFLYSPFSAVLVVVPVKTMPALIRDADSTILRQRLHEQFPPGADERKIILTLTEQGFSPMESSKKDKTIHIYYFESQFGVFSDIRSTVSWKVDKDNKIVWTEGTIAHLIP